MTLPVLPSPQSITTAQLADYGAQVVAWADEIDDVAEVRDATNKWAAITEYARRSSREGIAEAEATLRRLEERCGHLLGPAPGPGARTDIQPGITIPGDIDRHVANDFRMMAEHPEIVEQVIAESSDANPPSRRKVLAAIKDIKAAAATSQADADLEAEIERRQIKTLDNPAEIRSQRERNETIATFGGVIAEVLMLRDKYGVHGITRHHTHPLFCEYRADAQQAVQFLSALLAEEVAA